MKVRLDEIGDEGYAWHVEERLDPETIGREELVKLSPIDWRGKITRVSDGYYLRAAFAYDHTLQCQRCLEPATEPVGGEIELLVVPASSLQSPDELELHEEDLGLMAVEGEEIDLGPLLEEQVQLNVPMRPVCSEDCAGLCPSCGARRSAGDCGCRDTEIDPRWAGLAALRDGLAGSDSGSDES